MQKFKCETPILKDKFEKHYFYKDKLLSIINNQEEHLENYNNDKLKKTNIIKTIKSFKISFEDIKKDNYKNINKEVKIIK